MKAATADRRSKPRCIGARAGSRFVREVSRVRALIEAGAGEVHRST
jgi:hypothetical protein